MPSVLINIGRTGAAAARASLELSAQNIANANNPDYTRRALGQSEFVGTATIDLNSADSLGGVRIGGIERFDSDLLQFQLRTADADLSRTEAELVGLRGAETALEQSGLYESLVDYEAALVRLESDPLDPTLRTAALETARQLTNTFQLANSSLGSARALAQSDVAAGVERVNGLASELARVNSDLAAAREGSAARAALLDQRDATLRDLSEEFGITATFDDKGLAQVRINGSPSVDLVQGATTFSLSSATAADGTVSYSVAGQAFTAESGAMSGRATALQVQADAQAELDAIAAAIITSGNSAQASGTASDGSPGQPLFSGTGAGDIAIALSSGAGLATAPAAAPAGSRDTSNLGNLITAIRADTGPIASSDTLLLGLSSRISGLDTRREGLAIIADSAEAELLNRVGVDLDAEAANLVRLQQAFEANSRVIQVAVELFDTILALR